MPKTLRLILGDQLNAQHSWFQQVEDSFDYVLMEIKPESQYVSHHIQKIVAFFLAMRNFAAERRAEGHQVKYFYLKDAENQQSFEKNILHLIESQGYEKFEYQYPDEYRLDQLFKELSQRLPIPTEAYDSEHFLSKREEVEEFFKGKKTYRLETFYRAKRQEYDIMMDGEEPLSGRWNYDAENRRKYDPEVPIPAFPQFSQEAEIIQKIQEDISDLGLESIGTLKPQEFHWPISRAQGLDLLDFFVKNALKHFGDFQDSMEPHEPFLFHSRLSFLMNVKLLSPLEVVQKVVEYWEANSEEIHISQTEGFVRQIIGWREYMRGVYWAKMPDYAQLNYFEQERKLPDYFWTGKTKMHCLQQAIGQSLKQAYAHHIQRLMITGNFALLSGIHPDEVDKWYLGIYIDAIEWVQITNTRGMSQFADGGIVGTKPYVSSANYIDKMSRYCSSCAYHPKKKVGEGACPFNSLYWHFYDRNRDKLEKNPRIGMAYRTLDRMKNTEEILAQAEKYLDDLENL